MLFNVHLKGGVIASTNAQNSELATNTFTFEDIQNDSHSQATSLSGSVGMSRSSDTLYDKNGKVISNPTRAQYADKTLKREKGETGLTGGIGIPLHESQSDSSLTKATLTEGKITLNKDSQPTQTTAKALGINTEIKNANEQVENTLNLDRTLQEQTAVQTAVANLQEAAKTYVDNKRQEAQAEFDKVKQQHNKDSETYKTAEAAVKAWEIGGKNKQNIDTVTAVVSTVLAGSPAEQIAVAALSPTLNNQIHALTKDDNSKVTNILAHAVLGAIEAKAAGVNGASGAVAAAGAEIIAHTLAEQLYGVDGKTKTIDDLTQEEKQNILTLSQIGSAIAGGMTADSGYAAGVSGEIGKRAVEHNDFYDVPMGAMTDFEMVENIAKIYFDGDEEKATKFLMAFRKAEGEGVIDNVIGSVESLIHIDETVKSIGYVIAHPNETIENIKLSAEEWGNLLSYAMENDPTLAGEMLGYIKGSATAIPGTDLVLGGTIAKTAQKVIKLAKQSGAAFTSKIDDVGNLGVNNPKYDKALNETINNRANEHYINEQASKRVSSVTAPIDFDGHILNVEINKRGQLTGGHSIADGNVTVISKGEQNALGVYQAKISAVDPQTGKILTKNSTMFPDTWSASRIKVEVDAAYKNKVIVTRNGKHMWEGKTPSGVKVTGYLEPNTTVYPLMK
ncbi:EndoU domain-containing protein [uncultured Actinobacillus sp.]|uniref:EndoU domain-containing protein n=1 Tax=uncultured Actinobacillus sp. TaxID=417616 RepID=UPI0025E9631D|nr:EndoU domain-containing protein [uncultured Actinobacillus sp.]